MVAPHVLAVALEHVELVADRLRVPEQIARVGVLRDQSQGLLLPAPSDQDRWPAGLNGAREIEGAFDPVVLALERGRLVTEHRPADPDRFLEALEALADRGE